MKKSTIIFLSCLFLYSCSDDFYVVEEDTIIPENNISIQEDTTTTAENNTSIQEDTTIDSRSIIFQDKVVENGHPIEGAIVSIYANGKRYFDSTNSNGQYSLEVPADSLIKTGFISLSIFHPEYKSLNVSYKAPLESNSIYDSNSMSTTMSKCEHCLKITNNNYSELYHLGDANFSGPSNSQFQKDTDGVEVSFNFVNLGSISKLKLSFEAKGIDYTSEEHHSAILFGDQAILLEKSHSDGSYKNYVVEFENDININTIKFKSSEPKSSNGDVDDWEFTSFYVERLD